MTCQLLCRDDKSSTRVIAVDNSDLDEYGKVDTVLQSSGIANRNGDSAWFFEISPQKAPARIEQKSRRESLTMDELMDRTKEKYKVW